MKPRDEGQFKWKAAIAQGLQSLPRELSAGRDVSFKQIYTVHLHQLTVEDSMLAEYINENGELVFEQICGIKCSKSHTEFTVTASLFNKIEFDLIFPIEDLNELRKLLDNIAVE